MMLRELYPDYDIGEGSYGLLTVFRWGQPKRTDLHIGKYSSFAYNTIAILGGEHRIDWVTQYPFSTLWPEMAHVEGHPATRGPIEIGNDVWMGASSMVLSGTTIGDGAVVSARCVVRGHVAPYSIVSGNPMRHVGWRFEESIRARLLRLAWWDWPRERLLSFLPLMLSGDVKRFLAATEERQ